MLPSVVLATALLLWSLIGNLLVGDTLYVTRNLLLGVLVVLLVHRAGGDWAALGLDAGGVKAGVRWGALAIAVVVAALLTGVALADHLPGVEHLLADERADLSTRSLTWHALWRIPVGTAAFEEVAFRGALLGLLLQQTSPVRAVAISSVVFGLWHVAPTIVTLRANDVAVASGQGMGTIVGAVLVTTAAGVLFCLLRLGSGSLLAPILAHWATNSGGLIAAALRQGGD